MEVKLIEQRPVPVACQVPRPLVPPPPVMAVCDLCPEPGLVPAHLLTDHLNKMHHGRAFKCAVCKVSLVLVPFFTELINPPPGGRLGLPSHGAPHEGCAQRCGQRAGGRGLGAAQAEVHRQVHVRRL